MQKQVGEAIAHLDGVVSKHKRGYENGKLNIYVQYKGSTDSFGEAIDGKLIVDKILSVIEASIGRIVIDLR